MLVRGPAPVGAADRGTPMNRLIVAIPLLAVAACSSEPEVKMDNASVSEVAKEMRKAETARFLNPGKWEHVVTLLEMDVPGMPPEAKSMMQQAMAKAQKFDHCLTPEQAAKPSEDFFTKADQNCRFEHYEWGDGKIDMKMNCTHAAGHHGHDPDRPISAGRLFDGLHASDRGRRGTRTADHDQGQGRCQAARRLRRQGKIVVGKLTNQKRGK